MAESARVLIVDDEAAARYGITRALESQGYSLEDASNGREALELIRRFAPDVIVSDINMPEMDGLTLLREVKSDARSPLVVLITAYGSEGVAIEALRAGAYDYLAKPFELDELRAVVRNAVGQKQLRRELDNALAELAQSEKMATLGRLVAGVAHEINTPLGTLQSSADTLRRAALRIAGGEAAGPLSDVVKAAAEQTQIASGRISSIVANLEAFAQLDRAEFQQVNLHEGLERTIAVLAPGWNAQIEMTPEFGELPEIECRPRDLNQLFMNLLLNAQEAIERNGGRGVIRVRTQAGDGEVRVEIEDDGIAAGPLDRIFEPRFTTEGGRIGAGLGMAACNQIARAHGGRIEVESSAEAGSVFRVILPVRRPA